MHPQELLLYADRLARALMADGDSNSLTKDEVIKSAIIAVQLMKASYPNRRRLFRLQQEADGLLAMVSKPSGDPC